MENPSILPTPGPSPSAAGVGEGDGDFVRAPIAARVDQLYELGPAGAYVSGAPAASDPFRNFHSDYSSDSQRKKWNNPSLSSLFRPPIHLLHEGTFDQTRIYASNTKKQWLLINIQSTSEFASHRLNRDTWSAAPLQTLLEKHFVFWQQNNTTPAGQHYIRFYHPESMPHIAVMDPRTKEKLREW